MRYKMMEIYVETGEIKCEHPLIDSLNAHKSWLKMCAEFIAQKLEEGIAYEVWDENNKQVL